MPAPKTKPKPKRSATRAPGILQDRAALVTGGGAGLGRAVAHVFAAAGARVLVSDRDGASAEQVAQEIVEAGGIAEAMRVDVADLAQVAAMIERVETTLGPLYAAVNNAGTAQPGPDDDEDELRRVMGVNVGGVRHAMKHQLRVMRPRREGVIVNVSSNLAIRPSLGQTIYAASKAAVIGLSRGVARMVAREGVRVNVVCPGAFPSTLLHTSVGGDVGVRMLENIIPVGRLGTTDEIARACLWLCGPDTPFVIGHALVIDGGVAAW